MLSLPVSDIKDCMNKLLLTDSFDRFCLVQADVKAGITLCLDGHLNPDFFDSDDEKARGQRYCLWQEARPYVCQFIRGKRQPLSFKIILAFPEKTVDFFVKESQCSFGTEDIEGIYLNILFEPGNLRITTGISCSAFSLDKSLEHCVDDHVRAFLKRKGVG